MSINFANDDNLVIPNYVFIIFFRSNAVQKIRRNSKEILINHKLGQLKRKGKHIILKILSFFSYYIVVD